MTLLYITRVCAHAGSRSPGLARNEPQLTRQKLRRGIPPETPAPWVRSMWLGGLGSRMQRGYPLPRKKKKDRSHSIALGHVNAAQALASRCQSGLPSCRVPPSSFHGVVGTSCLWHAELRSAAFGVSEGCKGLALTEQWVGVSSCCPFSLPLPSCCPHTRPTSALC